MGSLRSLRRPRQDRVGALSPKKFTNSMPDLPDLSAAEAKARHYSFDLTRYRIVRVLEVQDCYRDVLSRLLGRIDIRSSEDMDVEYYLSDNEIDWVAGGLRDEGVVEYTEGFDSHGRRWYGYTLITENSLTPIQQLVLQALWESKNGLSVRQLRSAIGFPSSSIQDILEELKADDRVVEGRRGNTSAWKVVV